MAGSSQPSWIRDSSQGSSSLSLIKKNYASALWLLIHVEFGILVAYDELWLLCNVIQFILPDMKKNPKHWGGVIQHLFLFSTSATSSSVENWPLTTRIRFLMTSSEQSTSKRPPTTTGRRLGLTLNTHWQDLVKLFVEDVAKLMLDCHFLLPSEHRSQCTSADCCGTGKGPDHGRSRIGHRRWSVAVGRWVLLPKCHAK